MKDLSKEQLEFILVDVMRHFALAAKNIYSRWDIAKYPLIIKNGDGSWSKQDDDYVYAVFNLFFIGESLYPYMKEEFSEKKEYHMPVQWAEFFYRKYKSLPDKGDLPNFLQANSVNAKGIFR